MEAKHLYPIPVPVHQGPCRGPAPCRLVFSGNEGDPVPPWAVSLDLCRSGRREISIRSGLCPEGESSDVVLLRRLRRIYAAIAELVDLDGLEHGEDHEDGEGW